MSHKLGLRQPITVLDIAKLSEEIFRVTLDVTSNGTIIHPLRFLFLDELQLTTVLREATPLLPVLIKYLKRILFLYTLGSRAYWFLHILHAGALATAYKLGGAFNPVWSAIRL